jgi:hypothetical protein
MFSLAGSSDTISGGVNTQKKELVGYEEIPRDEWMDLEIKSYIRYEKPDGVMTKGGFIYAKSIERNTFSLRSDLYDSSSSAWVVHLDKIKKIWKKNGNPENQNSDVLGRMIKQLHGRLSVLENGPNLDETVSEKLSADITQLKIDVTNIQHDIKEIYVYLESLNKYISGS